jgi:chemotaxis family two-component system sensor kinase Cph1
LRNMGVRATMTISIIIRGELWGMVAAHHGAPRRLDFLTRSICGLLGKVLAAQIVARSDNAALQERLRSRELIKSYMISLEHSVLPWHGEAFETVPLLELLHADALISRVDGVAFRHGTSLEEAQLQPVIAALRKLASRGIASSKNLVAIEPGANAFSHEASGALYLGLSESSDDYILLLRREVIGTIVWAGNPDKSILRDEANGSLNPRASFASWEETVHDCSLPWTELELQNAHLLREQLINARLERDLREREVQYQQERARSTIFQRAVLPPRLPTVEGLSFDAVYEPGLNDANVGGDWYDAVRLIDGRVLLTIGDVAGSGVNAAVMMGVVRQIMRGIAQLHAEPALMLDAADRALRLEYPEAFVTAWVGVFDLVGRTLSYASAGHPPPLLLEPNGEVRELDHRTLPIGLRQGHQGHASTIDISHGSALWLYTDGLIEATHNVLEGSRVLRETALRLGPAAVAHPAATIRRLVIPNGSPDDVAILVVRTNFNESERYMTRSHFDSADAFAARAARRNFVASLSPAAFSDVDVANAEIVFGELCGNVARYAPGRVDVALDCSGIQAVLHVMDRGSGFRHLSRLPVDVFSEAGRGLFIIASMTTEFTVAPRMGGGSHARAVLVGRYPISLLRDVTLPALSDQIAAL